MARSDTPTQLPLDRYATIMGIYLPHFNGLNGTQAPLVKGCSGGQIWDQDDRDDLALTIAQAEEMIATELGFQPVPTFFTDERIALALPGVRFDWRNAEIQTQWAQVECYGTETLTEKQADAGVQYSDDDDDPFGRQELATIGSAMYLDLDACDEACEVAVFFRVADGAEDAADPRWEIKPIKVDIDGDTMHITAAASMFVRPDLWKLTKADSAGHPNSSDWIINYDTANFVSQVDVYCRTVNQETPVTVFWDGVCNCPGICEHETQLGCAYPTDFKRGYFAPRTATWNGTRNIDSNPQHGVPPESVTVDYRAGYPLDRYGNCRMNAQLERAIVKLTNALLPEPPCGFCDPAKNRWRQDREDVNPLTAEAANLPWDLYKQGALEAWRIVKKFARGRGMKMGRGYR